MKHNCPICKTAVDSEVNKEFPFCSERCKDIDLGNWATERYVISEPSFDEEALEKLMLLEPEEENENTPSDSNDSDSRK
ncbi:MAG TPA: DNA gyrase inhibitor YacG [Candidatus Acidoferrales bacterium]